MKTGLVKSYLKYNYKQIIVSLIILNVFYWWMHDFYLFYLFLFVIGFARDLYHFREKLDKQKKLKAKGLTEEDIINIEFVKKWEETRIGGMWKYCVRDGGIIAGAGLALALSLLYAIIFPGNFSNIISEPGDMMMFIGYSYIAGATFGVILFRIRWSYNEKKFIRLTDPLNNIFKAKTASFDDLV
jgi:hypothetical protein